MKALDVTEYVERANRVHGGKYDYAKTKYQSARGLVEIRCPKHGVFEQTAANHLKGRGCRECGKEKAHAANRSNTEIFIGKALAVHGDKYDYASVQYKNVRTKIIIRCRKHGTFVQTPDSHIAGQGCNDCANERGSEQLAHTTADFTTRAVVAHGDKYDYCLVEYKNSKAKVKIICPTHGVFQQIPNDHTQGVGCPKCGNYGPSKGEIELSDYIATLAPVERSNRTIIAPYEIDCAIPSKNLGIEYCGNYFHSDEFKPDSYHLDKLNLAASAGYALVQVFEDEWLDKRDIVKSVLKGKLGAHDIRVFARTTEVREVSQTETADFLNANHLQGATHAQMSLGLYVGTELLMVATFSSERKILKGLEHGWIELVRLCTKLNTSVVGGFSKLLKYAVSTLKPKGIKTFCDRRYFNGKGYEAVGFVKSHDSQPNYFYLGGDKSKRHSRHGFQKHKLVNKLPVYYPDKTERENMSVNGYTRIYDCGNTIFKLFL